MPFLLSFSESTKTTATKLIKAVDGYHWQDLVGIRPTWGVGNPKPSQGL